MPNRPRCLRDLAGVIHDLVASRLSTFPTVKRETRDEFSTAAIFPTGMPYFLRFPRL